MCSITHDRRSFAGGSPADRYLIVTGFLQIRPSHQHAISEQGINSDVRLGLAVDGLVNEVLQRVYLISINAKQVPRLT